MLDVISKTMAISGTILTKLHPWPWISLLVFDIGLCIYSTYEATDKVDESVLGLNRA